MLLDKSRTGVATATTSPAKVIKYMRDFHSNITGLPGSKDTNLSRA